MLRSIFSYGLVPTKKKKTCSWSWNRQLGWVTWQLWKNCCYEFLDGRGQKPRDLSGIPIDFSAVQAVGKRLPDKFRTRLVLQCYRFTCAKCTIWQMHPEIRCACDSNSRQIMDVEDAWIIHILLKMLAASSIFNGPFQNPNNLHMDQWYYSNLCHTGAFFGKDILIAGPRERHLQFFWESEHIPRWWFGRFFIFHGGNTNPN